MALFKEISNVHKQKVRCASKHLVSSVHSSGYLTFDIQIKISQHSQMIAIQLCHITKPISRCTVPFDIKHHALSFLQEFLTFCQASIIKNFSHFEPRIILKSFSNTNGVTSAKNLRNLFQSLLMFYHNTKLSNSFYFVLTKQSK